MQQLNDNGTNLCRTLDRYEQDHKQEKQKGEKVHVIGVGGTLTSAYEQLRNAAEYTEEHLLLQRAIGRFFRRTFVRRDKEAIHRSGHELVVELTLAGYVSNDSVEQKDLDKIDDLAEQYFGAYSQLEKHKKITLKQVKKWSLDVLAVKVERLFNDHDTDTAFTEFAYNHYQNSLDFDAIFTGKKPDNYLVSLYAAVHLALLRADEATIRTTLLERYHQSPHKINEYIALNQQIDELLKSDDTKKLYMLINREGAPERILRQMLENIKSATAVLKDKSKFLHTFSQQIEAEYARAEDRINRAIIKSVLFLLITKVLIGMAIEVPYDRIVHGEIIWTPLIVNLFFPPLFMLLLRYTLVLPGSANTRALLDRGEALLYDEEKGVALRRKKHNDSTSRKLFGVFYGLFGLLIIAAVIWLLLFLQFSWLHIIIFFIFTSTASFLGFRLSRIVRELEVGEAEQSILATVRDFIYMPFVFIGRWLSRTYSQVNIIALILDMVIELPLKTLLRLVRQWTSFLNERKDEI